ncbi:hypothetical protein [Lacihabitans soyangensis]|uniref:Carboxypeptidase-like regulatory domain-containing protein n=1 Tax=Lacihabitans soyangensis TaxID=869394 RepID=A0AAE3H6C4_9BACT|nr:hypothetical protein [Lacihabitans soyangensis]MCP9765662.1 hypothetical protein [Lacihabitans soyangensis]
MIVLFLLSYLFSLQFNPINLKIVNAETGQVIPYVTYTRLFDFKGSFSDENGNIQILEHLDKQYVISCIGYKNDTIVPSKSTATIFLNPSTIELPELEVSGRKNKEKIHEIGYLKGFSVVPYYSSLPRKMAICTFIPSSDKSKKWTIQTIKINIGANKSKNYDAFLIRLFIKENNNKTPGKDLLTRDLIARISTNSQKYSFQIEGSILMPTKGCFVGLETVGKIDKKGNFTAFSDFYEKPDKPFQLSVKMVKSDSYSLVKYGGFNSWFLNNRTDNNPDTYAIGLEVTEIK